MDRFQNKWSKKGGLDWKCATGGDVKEGHEVKRWVSSQPDKPLSKVKPYALEVIL